MDFSVTKYGERVREWQYLTGADFAQMDRENTVAILSCSPLEVHGPHLPTVTDSLEAEALLLRIVEKLAEVRADLAFVHLPPVYVATDVVPKPGSVAFRSSTVRRVITDIGRTLAKQGFRRIWVTNFHGGPRHFVAIEAACHRINRRYGTQMISIFGALIRRLTGGSTDIKDVIAETTGVSAEALAGDTHGGAVETSMMLHLLEHYVDPSFRQLERQTIEQYVEQKGGRPLSHRGVFNVLRSFREKLDYWKGSTYAGDPALATPEIGERVLERLAEHGSETLTALLDGKLPEDQWHSPLFAFRHLLLARPFGWLLERSVGFSNPIF